MDCWNRIYSLLILFAFHMLHLVNGTATTTTMVPLCKEGESAENCTTAMVKTADSSKKAPVKITACKREMDNYCLNGQCIYHVDLDEHSCRCERGYSGSRCAHSELVFRPMNQEYLAITIFLAILLLLAVAVALFFAHQWYKNKKLRQSSTDYKEVNTHNV
ncbi:proepiregulin-like [Rhinophrynus dorsalis]